MLGVLRSRLKIGDCVLRFEQPKVKAGKAAPLTSCVEEAEEERSQGAGCPLLW